MPALCGDALRYLELLDAEPDAEVAVAAVEPLQHARSVELVAVLAERARKDANPLRRRVAILGLAGKGEKLALDALLQVASSEPVDDVRADAVRVLGLGLSDARHSAERVRILEVIGKNLSHRHEETRFQAVLALVASPSDPDLKKKLKKMAASDPSKKVAATAAHVLKRWGARSR